MSKYKKMKKIKEEVVACKKCPLFQKRNLPVVGEGSHEAKIMFVGEGPGANEDATGRPFCGKAGSILNELLKSIGIDREKVYITNILKCRPPNNRDPHEKEVKACTPYLKRQIKIIEPEVLCPLGRHAMYFIMEQYGLQGQVETISKIHGQVFKAKSLLEEIKIIPFYHPAVATYNPNKLPLLKKDFEVLKEYK